MTGWSSASGRSRSGPRSTAWTCPGCMCCTPWATPSPSTRPSPPGARSAVIVGGGYIGLEMAEAFTSRGLEVTVVEQAPAVMPTVDLELGRLLGQELRRHEVEVVTDV